MAVVCGDVEPEALVEPFRRIDLEHVQRHPGLLGFLQKTLNQRAPEAPSLVLGTELNLASSHSTSSGVAGRRSGRGTEFGSLSPGVMASPVVLNQPTPWSRRIQW